MSKILKNTTGSLISINDMGVSVPGSGQYTIPSQDYPLWVSSDDVITYIGAGTIVVNNGTDDLGKSAGIDLIKGIFPQPLVIRDGASSTLAGVTAGNRFKVEVDYAPGAVPAYAFLSLIIGDGSTVISSGTTGYSAPIPFGGTITGWTIAEVSSATPLSSIAVDLWKDTIVNYPPTGGDLISGTEPPSLVNQRVGADNTLTTWTTSVAANDCFGFTVASTNGIAKKVHITIHMTRNV
jgi:hypothetical protein